MGEQVVEAEEALAGFEPAGAVGEDGAIADRKFDLPGVLTGGLGEERTALGEERTALGVGG